MKQMATGRAHSGSFLSDLKWLQVSVPLANKDVNDRNPGQFVKQVQENQLPLKPIVCFINCSHVWTDLSGAWD